MLAHRSHGRVRVLQGIAFGLVGAAGSVAGTGLSLAVPADVLLAGFSVLMLAVAGPMLSRVRTPAGVAAVQGSDPVPPEVPIVTFSPRFVCACRGQGRPDGRPTTCAGRTAPARRHGRGEAAPDPRGSRRGRRAVGDPRSVFPVGQQEGESAAGEHGHRDQRFW